MPEFIEDFLEILYLFFQLVVVAAVTGFHPAGMGLCIHGYQSGVLVHAVPQFIDQVALENELVLKMFYAGHGFLTVILFYDIYQAPFQGINIILIKVKSFDPFLVVVAAVGYSCVIHKRGF